MQYYKVGTMHIYIVKTTLLRVWGGGLLVAIYDFFVFVLFFFNKRQSCVELTHIERVNTEVDL